MNLYEPPKTQPLEPSLDQEGMPSWTNFVAGAASYYLYHQLAGVLGNASWPSPIKALIRFYRPITLPLMDMLLTGVPIVVAFVVVAYAWFRLLGSRTSSAVFLFCVGWLLPMLGVLSYGEFESPGVFLDSWVKWPHVAFVQFSPILGIWLGFRLASKRPLRASHVAA